VVLKEALDSFDHGVCGKRDSLVRYGKRNGNSADFIAIPCDDNTGLEYMKIEGLAWKSSDGAAGWAARGEGAVAGTDAVRVMEMPAAGVLQKGKRNQT
jgi:hypothetical protein